MRHLELRRHAQRDKPHDRLSAAGRDLARHVGKTIGPFSHVLASPAERARETATAMGFTLDATCAPPPVPPELAELLDRCLAEKRAFRGLAQAQAGTPALASYLRQLREFWLTLAASVPEDAAALVITHAGILELSALACLPAADPGTWGPAFAPCEGIRLAYAGGDFQSGVLLRVLA
ncbi:MAG: histidine phosphatase family protein [Lentisphaeria bacterium]|jgi:broad specificity phosphatase PhoE